MSDRINLSVIVPAYNAEKYLQRCIESLELSLENACITADSEVIVINDGSKDKTSDICSKLRERFDNVKTIELNDLGVSAARNAGLNIATGKYISFVDADDVVDIGMFGKLLSVAEAKNADIAGCGFSSWDGKESFVPDNDNENFQTHEENREKEHEPKYELYSPKEFIEKQFLVNNTRCWSKIYRKDTISGVIFKEGLTIGEDMLFLLQTVKKSSVIAEYKEYKGYGYYRNPVGAIERPFTPKYMDQILCWKLVKEELADLIKENTDIERIIVARLIMGILLVVSKIATTNADAKEYVNTCHEEIKTAIKDCPEAVSYLDGGYKLKTFIFKNFPKLYLKLYGLWKS